MNTDPCPSSQDANQLASKVFLDFEDDLMLFVDLPPATLYQATWQFATYHLRRGLKVDIAERLLPKSVGEPEYMIELYDEQRSRRFCHIFSTRSGMLLYQAYVAQQSEQVNN
ncbi:hypothetical protein [Hymenobacter sp. YC55]|uniref:hypothetical protein n=1 Tax=Hymenobacter sp. YC55 TaxID=3034019 RepID=UPI0023F8A977|nr:hypothetical protein [Hymenobacter sp. YC55]MDF7812868.1 hypothetical protein [Hymenobacter sp. YC55]